MQYYIKVKKLIHKASNESIKAEQINQLKDSLEEFDKYIKFNGSDNQVRRNIEILKDQIQEIKHEEKSANDALQYCNELN